jgi:protein involved in polysaccharide export with SLBB domain
MSKIVLASVLTVLGVTSVFAQGAAGPKGSSRARVIANSELSENRPDANLANPSAAASESSKKTVSLSAAPKPSETVLNHASNTTTPKTRPRTSASNGTVVASPAPENQLYRVGVGDVLDVRLVDMPNAKSSLFTVLDGGMLDYPLSNAPVAVAGLTEDQIAEQLRGRIKVLDNPKLVVKVRDYSSHNVIVTGFVFDPGARSLRREATPFYVVLAEAQPRPEAVSAFILRDGMAPIKIDLKDQTSVATLVMSGDVIKVLGSPSEPLAFFFSGGALSSPGQKTFHNGLTLTQAILASGGVTRTAGSKASVSRQGADGRLVTTEYNLRQIQEGKSPDPVLQKGDRISVGEGR